MATGKETPRQKMISMMYLVLTALLALNVSKEILDSFVIVNKALANTNISFKERNEILYSAFENLHKNDPVKTGPFWERAKKAKSLSLKMDSCLRELKILVISQTEKIDRSVADTIELKYIEQKDNYDIPTNILVGEKEDGSSGKASEIKKLLLEYKKELTNLLPENERKYFRAGEEIGKMENHKDWVNETFFHAPLAASVTMITKLQSDVRNAESEVIQRLYAQVNQDDFKFDTLAAKVIAPATYIMLGDEYKADVFVAAFSTTQNPVVMTGDYDAASNKFIGNADTVEVSKGIGKVALKGMKEGLNKYRGVVNIKGPDGTVKPYPFESEFIVARPSAVVSPINMNVLYTDVENPLAISVPGVSADKVKVSISNGSISKNSKGEYIAKVTTAGMAEVRVMAEVDGKSANMGTLKFRVKRVPNPILYVGSVGGGGRIKKGELIAQIAPIAKFDNFDFNLVLNIKAFKVIIKNGSDLLEYDIIDNKFSPVVREKFRTLKQGQKIYIEEVKAVDNLGIPRKVADVSLTIM